MTTTPSFPRRAARLLAITLVAGLTATADAQTTRAATATGTTGGTVRGLYEFNYDVLRGRYLQQRTRVEYNAQCCGVRVEYQYFNFAGLGHRAVIPQDRRINLSFTLAGLGTFANVLGAFGGGAGGP